MITLKQDDYLTHRRTENAKYTNGVITSEELDLFTADLELIRGFKLPEEVGPNAPHRRVPLR
ncbi:MULTISPECIES: hypothetical protein [unclassified Paenibacillus]|uniref:hypothetical protein n=1 Tax=unclassified Paenibacillus TaxID=185978 RepID=UPI000CFC208C|nr:MULTISPECIES: hypothetical protein [unclassified Paenibacillus]MBD8839124.1 hypothetical protein [Paenibacillus sp. CFBP 13594]PRA05762.1 hypothetical protein CQ043_17390 [Paenibacillus sp. MYb63]PRA49888.1 hypothetical protein CQ061_05440 [Paenibacillus sp. MYb67]